MNSKSSQGSVLLSTLTFITLLSVAAITLMEMSKGTYTLTLRNEWRAQARTVAESELEYVYYQFKTKIMTAVLPDNIVDAMSAWCENATAPSNCTLTPSSYAYRGNFTVGRSISYDPTYDKISGNIPGTTKYGTIFYITVYVEVRPAATSPFANLPPHPVFEPLCHPSIRHDNCPMHCHHSLYRSLVCLLSHHDNRDHRSCPRNPPLHLDFPLQVL